MAMFNVDLDNTPTDVPPVAIGPKLFTVADPKVIDEVKEGNPTGVKLLNVRLVVNDDPMNRSVFRRFKLGDPRDMVNLKQFVLACGVDIKQVSSELNTAQEDGVGIVPCLDGKVCKGIVSQATGRNRSGQPVIYTNVNTFLYSEHKDFNLPVTPA